MANIKNDNDRHVVANKRRGGWDVVKEDRKRVSAHYEKLSEAIDRARTIVTNLGGGEIVVYGEDGRIRAKDTVGGGNDPRRSKG